MPTLHKLGVSLDAHRSAPLSPFNPPKLSYFQWRWSLTHAIPKSHPVKGFSGKAYSRERRRNSLRWGWHHGNACQAAFRPQGDMHDAFKYLNRILEPAGISKVDASLRWLCYHPQRTMGDTLILSQSSLPQLDQNGKAVRKGPRPDDFVAAIDNMWEYLHNLHQKKYIARIG